MLTDYSAPRNDSDNAADFRRSRFDVVSVVRPQLENLIRSREQSLSAEHPIEQDQDSCGQRRLLQDVDHEQGDNNHHRAGDAVNGEGCRLRPAGEQNVAHIAEGDKGQS